MTEYQPTHLLSVRIERWTPQEYTRPGLVAPRDFRDEHYRGSPEDCDEVAKRHGVTELTSDSPATDRIPFHDRVYTSHEADGGVTEVWCRAQSFETRERTAWTNSLPVVERSDRHEHR